MTFPLLEKSMSELQQMMADGVYTSLDLVELYLARIEQIDQQGPMLNAVIELNPEAREIARRLDEERVIGDIRGPLHGIPLLIKDNIDTGDQMLTTAGSLALVGQPAPADAFVVQKLREAGAIILGKSNLSEWANFRSNCSSSGWSSRGGQTRNAYGLDRSPSGSSSGSGTAVAASLCAVAVGTETDGSITSPAAANGLVGIKPTVGLVSRRGIIPISATQDTAGPMARTVADAAVLLSAMAGRDEVDLATHQIHADYRFDYGRYLNKDGLLGVKLGVVRSFFGRDVEVDRQMVLALARMKELGATLVEGVELPEQGGWGHYEYEVLLYEFKDGLNRYLASRGASIAIKSLAELITFNEAERGRVMPIFGQDTLVAAQEKGGLTEAPYLEALQMCRLWSQEKGLDVALDGVDLLVGPSRAPAWLIDHVNGDSVSPGVAGYPAVAGYPHITLPLGYVHGLPINLSLIGRPWDEGKLIGAAFAFEQGWRVRQSPEFLPYTAVL